MNGRLWRKLSTAAVLTAGVGCKSGPALPPGAPALPNSGPKFSLFPPKPPGPPATATVEAAANQPPLKKGPLKAETIAAIADVQADAAFNNEDADAAERNRFLDEARLKYQKALERDPKNLEALRGLARLYTRSGDREQAAAAYAALVKYYPADHKVIYEQSLAAARFEDWEGAAAACRRALELDPGSMRYTRALGVCEARCGRYQEGLDAMAKVLPEAEARTALARVYADQGQGEAARQQLELAVKADPKYAAAQDFLAAISGGPPANPNGLQQAGGTLPAGN